MQHRNLNYLDDRIESMLISKIAHHRLYIREVFKTRHTQIWPELVYKTIIGDIRTLKVWLRMAELIDLAKFDSTLQPKPSPYATYVAKELTL